MLAWLRRIVVSIGIGGASYALMLGIMVLSVVYDRELEPVITFAFDAGRQITNTLDSLVSGTYWGQVAVNHLRERVNMTHVVLSIPAIVIAAQCSETRLLGSSLCDHGPVQHGRLISCERRRTHGVLWLSSPDRKAW